ncbi:MAG: hypothetical protein FWF60_03765 [Oscillospiraceae bacterium]|nr:hypothetical protein [Oscillospiraceae bacterium]
MKDIEKVTVETIRQIISTRQPRGLYYTKEGRRLYVGVDNSYGEAWTEDFPSRRKCLRWLCTPNLDAEGNEL